MRLRDWEFLQRKIKMIIAIQIQKQFLFSIQTIVNGYSYFGMREGGNYPIGSIIIDDVHACMDKIISQFMIKIDAESDAYNELIAIFSSSLKDYNPKTILTLLK